MQLPLFPKYTKWAPSNVNSIVFIAFNDVLHQISALQWLYSTVPCLRLWERVWSWVVMAAGVLGTCLLSPVAVPVPVSVHSVADSRLASRGVNSGLWWTCLAPQSVPRVREFVAVWVEHGHQVHVQTVEQRAICQQLTSQVCHHRGWDPLASVHTCKWINKYIMVCSPNIYIAWYECTWLILKGY